MSYMAEEYTKQADAHKPVPLSRHGNINKVLYASEEDMSWLKTAVYSSNGVIIFLDGSTAKRVIGYGPQWGYGWETHK